MRKKMLVINHGLLLSCKTNCMKEREEFKMQLNYNSFLRDFSAQIRSSVTRKTKRRLSRINRYIQPQALKKP